MSPIFCNLSSERLALAKLTRLAPSRFWNANFPPSSKYFDNFQAPPSNGPRIRIVTNFGVFYTFWQVRNLVGQRGGNKQWLTEKWCACAWNDLVISLQNYRINISYFTLLIQKLNQFLCVLNLKSVWFFWSITNELGKWYKSLRLGFRLLSLGFQPTTSSNNNTVNSAKYQCCVLSLQTASDTQKTVLIQLLPGDKSRLYCHNRNLQTPEHISTYTWNKVVEHEL